MKHATGPRPITRADGSTAYSSGAIHTLCIRAANWIRPRTTKDASETATSVDHADTVARLRRQEQYDPR
jgi:hypothetical protein